MLHAELSEVMYIIEGMLCQNGHSSAFLLYQFIHAYHGM